MKRILASPSVKTGLKLALALALLAWLARSGRLDLHLFANLDARALLWLALSATLQGAMIVAMAARWRAWLQAPALDDSGARARLSWRETLLATGRGACLGAWTPAGLGLDGIRAAHALKRFHRAPRPSLAATAHDAPAGGHDAPAGEADEPEASQPQPASLMSLLRGASGGAGGAKTQGVARVVGVASLLDRLVALAALLILALPFLLGQLATRLGPWSIFVALGAVVVGVALGAWRWAGRARAGRGDFRWKHAAGGVAWSLATHVANILSMGAVIEALTPGLPVWRALSLAFWVGPMIVLSSAIPLTPLGLGVADATGEALIAAQGLSCGGETVMMGRVLWLAVCLLAGLAFWIPDPAPRE